MNEVSRRPYRDERYYYIGRVASVMGGTDVYYILRDFEQAIAALGSVGDREKICQVYQIHTHSQPYSCEILTVNIDNAVVRKIYTFS